MIITSFIASLHSYFALYTKEATEIENDFISRNTKNRKFFLQAKAAIKNMLKVIVKVFLAAMNKEELMCYSNIFNKNNYLKMTRTQDIM